MGEKPPEDTTLRAVLVPYIWTLVAGPPADPVGQAQQLLAQVARLVVRQIESCRDVPAAPEVLLPAKDKARYDACQEEEKEGDDPNCQDQHGRLMRSRPDHIGSPVPRHERI